MGRAILDQSLRPLRPRPEVHACYLSPRLPVSPPPRLFVSRLHHLHRLHRLHPLPMHPSRPEVHTCYPSPRLPVSLPPPSLRLPSPPSPPSPSSPTSTNASISAGGPRLLFQGQMIKFWGLHPDPSQGCHGKKKKKKRRGCAPEWYAKSVTGVTGTGWPGPVNSSVAWNSRCKMRLIASKTFSVISFSPARPTRVYTEGGGTGDGAAFSHGHARRRACSGKLWATGSPAGHLYCTSN